MSGGDGFLSRWSRRKQAVARGVMPDGVPEVVPDVVPDVTVDVAPDVVVAPVLPPIEGLGAGSDYSAFLQKGVAAVVQQAALRKAWTSDAGIAEFRGMADYDWDFNAAGYGRLRVTDDVVALLKEVLGPAETEAAIPAAVVEAVDAPSVRLSVAAAPGVPDVSEAVEEVVPAIEDVEAPRRHGSAMPA